MINFKFPVDHFGISAHKSIADLTHSALRQERKKAKRTLVTMAKISLQIPQDVDNDKIQVGILIDNAGQKWLSFLVPDPKLITYNPSAEDDIEVRREVVTYKEQIYGV